MGIRKPPELIRRHIDLLSELCPQRVVELGLFEGGSTALMAVVARPQRLLALDVVEGPLAKLEQFLEDHGLSDAYGMDQADRSSVIPLVEAVMEGPLDLVVDDASHRLAPTRASFEMLFPRLRPGGLYVLEDWSGRFRMDVTLHRNLHDPAADRHEIAVAALTEAMERKGLRPGSEEAQLELIEGNPVGLALELLLAKAVSPEAIHDLVVETDWVVIRRGSIALDPDSFSVTDVYEDPLELLQLRLRRSRGSRRRRPAA